jgi:hypothetical protein
LKRFSALAWYGMGPGVNPVKAVAPRRSAAKRPPTTFGLMFLFSQLDSVIAEEYEDPDYEPLSVI